MFDDISDLGGEHVLCSFDCEIIVHKTPVKFVKNIIDADWNVIKLSTGIKSKQMYLEGLAPCIDTIV